jgi:hypothetical protein
MFFAFFIIAKILQIRVYALVRNSSVVKRLATDWKIKVRGFDSRRGLGIFLFSIASRPALGPT